MTNTSVSEIKNKQPIDKLVMDVCITVDNMKELTKEDYIKILKIEAGKVHHSSVEWILRGLADVLERQ